MNVGSMQALMGSMPQSIVRGEIAQVGDQAGENVFGSVLLNITENQKASVANIEESDSDIAIDKAIVTMFSATTLEELIAGLELGGISIQELQNLNESNGFSHSERVDISNLIESIVPLLQEAGLSESEILAASTANDLWSLLEIVDEHAPRLFTELVTALEGKSMIPKEQAIDLLALLKTVAIVVPETDLTMKQEQQLFSLQGFLVTVGDQFESTLNTSQKRNDFVQLMEARKVVRFIMPNEANQENLKDTSSTQKTESSLVPAQTPKETVQQSFVNAQPVMRTEEASAELQNRNSARNETLLREMQAIFKRSNFGQIGGANRLLIKLYPEHLGQVRIELVQTNGIMTARILASNALGKEMLDSQLHQLRSAFVQQNLQVERIDISQMLENTSKNDHQHGMFNQHFKREQEDSNEQDEQNEEEMSFQEYMIELEA